MKRILPPTKENRILTTHKYAITMPILAWRKEKSNGGV